MLDSRYHARRLAALAVVLALTAAACGGDDDDAATATTEASTATSAPESATEATTATTEVAATTPASSADTTETTAAVATTEPASDDPLGTPDPASGDALKVGLITPGVGTAFDTSNDKPVSEAVAQWINEYRGGIGGLPIEILYCEDKQDPATAADCANEFIQEGVVAVVYGAGGAFEAAWKPLTDAGIPVFNTAVGAPGPAHDPNSTFLMFSGLATTIAGPIALAQEVGSDVLSVIVVNVPVATGFYTEGRGPQLFEDAGIKLDLFPVDFGVADMTPQALQLVESNPDGVVNILGNDAFCIAALQGLKTAGFTGTIMGTDSCITDATITAIGADLEGFRVTVQAPLGDPTDPGTILYNAILSTYAPDADATDNAANFPALALMGLDVATAGLTGDVTTESIIAAAKSMDETELPASGGRKVHCGANPDPEEPAVCSLEVLTGILDAEGKVASYAVVGADS